MKKIDLQTNFYRDVISSEKPVPLPSNLSNYWIDFLLSKESDSHKEIGGEQNIELTAAILKILQIKYGRNEFELSEHEHYAYIETFLTELSLEKISRVMGIEMTTATIDTIFTDRTIEINSESIQALLESRPSV